MSLAKEGSSSFRTSGAAHRNDQLGPVSVSSALVAERVTSGHPASCVGLESVGAALRRVELLVAPNPRTSVWIVRAEPKSVITARWSELTRILSYGRSLLADSIW